MSLETQFKLKENPIYLKYLRENSYWYKNLNRNKDSFKIFEQEVKTNYKLRPSDKILKAANTLEMIQKIMSTLK